MKEQLLNTLDKFEVKRQLPMHAHYWSIENLEEGMAQETQLTSVIHQTDRYNRTLYHKAISTPIKFSGR